MQRYKDDLQIRKKLKIRDCQRHLGDHLKTSTFKLTSDPKIFYTRTASAACDKYTVFPFIDYCWYTYKYHVCPPVNNSHTKSPTVSNVPHPCLPCPPVNWSPMNRIISQTFSAWGRVMCQLDIFLASSSRLFQSIAID